MSDYLDTAAKVATPIATLLGFSGVIIAFIYNEGKRAKEREMFIEETRREMAKHAADSLLRFTQNKERFEKIKKELADIKEGGTTFSIRAIADIRADLLEVNSKLHTFEATASEIKGLTINIEWVRKTLDEIKGTLKDMSK